MWVMSVTYTRSGPSAAISWLARLGVRINGRTLTDLGLLQPRTACISWLRIIRSTLCLPHILLALVNRQTCALNRRRRHLPDMYHGLGQVVVRLESHDLSLAGVAMHKKTFMCDLQYPTHRCYFLLMLMIIDETVLYSSLLIKNRAAFFRISWSSSERWSWALSPRISLFATSSSEACWSAYLA